MLNFILMNIGTILISVILIAVAAAVIIKLIIDKRAGKCPGCDIDCSVSKKRKCTKKQV